MTHTQRTVCEYCATLNLPDKDSCVACGAPLPKMPVPAARPVKIAGKATRANRELQEVRETADKAEVVARKALYAYSLLWRTLGEAAAIAICAFGIGLVGGAVGVPVLGVIGAVLVGLGVGVTIKIYYFALFSAPLGLVIGAVIGLVPFLLGVDVVIFVFTTTIFAFLAAVLFGYRIPYKNRNLYEKLRPFIGAAGGLVFGLLGMLLGVGLKAAVDALLKLI